MFDLKRPCTNCPFRKGKGEVFWFAQERLEEIFTATAFQCHKTVYYGSGEDGEETHSAGDRPQQCAGVMTVLRNENKLNDIMQVGSRLGALDLDALDPKKEAYQSFEEVFVAHKCSRKK